MYNWSSERFRVSGRSVLVHWAACTVWSSELPFRRHSHQPVPYAVFYMQHQLVQQWIFQFTWKAAAMPAELRVCWDFLNWYQFCQQEVFWHRIGCCGGQSRISYSLRLYLIVCYCDESSAILEFHSYYTSDLSNLRFFFSMKLLRLAHFDYILALTLIQSHEKWDEFVSYIILYGLCVNGWNVKKKQSECTDTGMANDIFTQIATPSRPIYRYRV